MSAKPVRLLIVEDEHALAQPLTEYLSQGAQRRRDHRAATRRRRGMGYHAPTTNRCRAPIMGFDVLLTLAKEADRAGTREDLGVTVVGTRYEGLDRGTNVHGSRLCRKLQRSGFDPSRVEPAREVGYPCAG